MFVKLDHFPNFRGENEKDFKPPVMSIAPCWCRDTLRQSIVPLVRMEHYLGLHQQIGTLQGINISHLGKKEIIFKMPFLGDNMLVSWRVTHRTTLLALLIFQLHP